MHNTTAIRKATSKAKTTRLPTSNNKRRRTATITNLVGTKSGQPGLPPKNSKMTSSVTQKITTTNTIDENSEMQIITDDNNTMITINSSAPSNNNSGTSELQSPKLDLIETQEMHIDEIDLDRKGKGVEKVQWDNQSHATISSNNSNKHKQKLTYSQATSKNIRQKNDEDTEMQ